MVSLKVGRGSGVDEAEESLRPRVLAPEEVDLRV